MAATNETIVYGLGELHLRVLLERLREVYRFEVNTRPPRIAYRETITAPAEGHHRHKKQTGGAGQFGEVFLRIEPLPRGAGFEFVDEVKGGTIPGQFIPAVEKGVREVLDARRDRRLPGGRRARRRLRRQAPQRRQQGNRLRHRRPQGLHRRRSRGARRSCSSRSCNIEITAPEHGDRRHHRRPVVAARPGQRHRQRRAGHDDGPRPGAAVGAVGYQSRLNAMTSGQGRYTIELSHYEAVPPAVQQR